MSPSRQHSKPLSNFPANSCVEGSGIPGPKALPWSDLRENENRCLPPTSWGRNQFIAAIKTVSSVCLGLNLCWALSVTSGRGACRRPLGSFPVGLYRNGGGLAVNTTWITWCAPRRDEDSGFACHCVCLKVWDTSAEHGQSTDHVVLVCVSHTQSFLLAGRVSVLWLESQCVSLEPFRMFRASINEIFVFRSGIW